MNTIVRWRPARYPRRVYGNFERIFGRALDTASPAYSDLALDVAETEEGFIVEATVPGVNPDDLEVTLEDNVLSIKGETHLNESIGADSYRLRERRHGSFGRSIRFPVQVDAGSVEASYSQGILRLEIPKAEEVKPRRIAVVTNGATEAAS